MKKISIFTITLILISAFCFLSPSKTSAQTGEGLTVSPPIQEIKLDPGKSYNETIKLNNPTQNIVTVYPVARNFTSSGETGVPAIENPNQDATYGLATWITFSQSKLALTPQQEIEFTYTITVPQNAEPGGHYASVLFTSIPPSPDKNSTQVSLNSMVGSLILGTVSGNIIEKGNVVEFDSGSHFYLKPPVNITLRIGNNGNVHFAPQGEIKINNFGKNVSVQDINPQKGNILPNSIRNFQNLKYSGKWYSFGKFDVMLAASYGINNQQLSGIYSFYIIPWWFIAIIAVIIILIILIIWRKKSKKRIPSVSFKKNSPSSGPIEKKKIILQ